MKIDAINEEIENIFNEAVDDGIHNMNMNLVDAIKKSINALKAMEVDTMNALYKRADDERKLMSNSLENKWEIHTILVPEKDVDSWQNKGLFPVVPVENNISYLNCAVEDLDKWHNFSGIEVCYDLLNQEKKIANLAEQYDISVPYIFSPWARRAVKIIDDKDNRNRDVLLSDYVLMWNVEFKTITQSGSIAPNGDELVYSYTFNISENGFCYSMYKDVEINHLLEDNRIELLTKHEILPDTVEEVIIHPLPEIVISKISSGKMMTGFKNMFKVHDKNKMTGRLLTKADIEYVLKFFDYDFAGERFNCSLSCINPKHKAEIFGYKDKLFHYEYPVEELRHYRRMRTLPVCEIGFEATNKKWLLDYMEYVLGYMEYRYPEYIWRGVEK